MEARRNILSDPLRAALMARVRGAGVYALWAAVCALLLIAQLILLSGTQGAIAIALTGALCLLISLWAARPALEGGANGEGATAGGASVGAWLCVALGASLAVAAHLSLISVVPGRYSRVIEPILEQMRGGGLLQATGTQMGNWNGVYLFVCALVSRLTAFSPMTALKLFDMACQFLCGAAVARLALLRGARGTASLGAMFAAMLAPTMLMNAGIWLHSDATFAMFALWGLFLLLADRPALGCALWGLALGTKPQGAFLFPLLLPMFMKGKVSLRDLLALAAAFLLSQIAILSQHGLMDVFSRYAMQIESTKASVGLGSDAPGVFGLMKVASVREFSGMGMGLAAALLVALAFLRARAPLPAQTWMLGALLLAAGLPQVLPQMNARCLYLAILLSLALCQGARRLFVCAALETVSLCAYMASLFGAQIFPMTGLSLLSVAAAALVLAELVAALTGGGPEAPEAPVAPDTPDAPDISNKPLSPSEWIMPDTKATLIAGKEERHA